MGRRLGYAELGQKSFHFNSLQYRRGDGKGFGQGYGRFLRISKGSVGELVTQLTISKEAGLLDVVRADALLAEARVVAGLPVGFIRYMEGKTTPCD